MKQCFLILMMLGLPLSVAAVEQTAFTIRSTEIKKQPYSDAQTLATLAEKSSVKIVLRKGGWVSISSTQGSGWVKMLNLRSNSASEERGDNGLRSLFNMGRSGSSGITVATGVRGLSEEDLKTASPNPNELAKMKNYAVSQTQAEKFARSGKLSSQTLEYIPVQ